MVGHRQSPDSARTGDAVAASTLTEVATSGRRLAGHRFPGPQRLRQEARPQDIAERVRKAADSLGYIPNAQAQGLAKSSSGLIGLIVHDIADPYFSGHRPRRPGRRPAAGPHGAAGHHRRRPGGRKGSGGRLCRPPGRFDRDRRIPLRPARGPGRQCRTGRRTGPLLPQRRPGGRRGPPGRRGAESRGVPRGRGAQ